MRLTYTLLVVGLHKINVRVCFAAPLNTWQTIELRHSVRASTNRSTELLAGATFDALAGGGVNAQ